MTGPVYLDFNATAPLRPEALAAMTQALAQTGNPSSVHAAGRTARALVEQARIEVARLVGVPAASLVFTGGGTEANGLAIQSAVAAGTRRLLVSAIEHDCVLETARASGVRVDLIPVDGRGVVDLEALADLLSSWGVEDGKPFVAIMAANNETGVIQPVAQAAARVAQAGGWLHVDAVQAAGRIPVDFQGLGAATLALSAHKLGGPQGVGALAFGPGAVLSRLQHGGGQERGRRAGTENVAGIAGFAAAARAAWPGDADPAPRDAAARALKARGAVVLGEDAPRLAETLCVALPGYSAELQVMALDLAGVMVSAGAACSSGKVKASRVIAAMGRPDLAACAIRVSGGWATEPSHWTAFVEAWSELQTRHAARQRATAA